MSKGDRSERRHPGEDDERQRTAFERDRDAILYTTAFRRLAGVTQVVSPSEGQVYHNRLTHTLEVAQIAQRLAESVCRSQDELAQHLSIDPSVVETAALAHDLGHPPFGHIAEKELNRLVVSNGSIDGYEGNAQSFRIITKVAVRNDHPGLNLTRASLNATLKYPWFQERTEVETQLHKKWGAYASDRDDFDFARKQHGENTAQCVEAQLMDWADDIAYSIHDTEDFYRAGLIPLELLSTNDAFVDEFLQKVFSRWEQKGVRNNYAEIDLATAFRNVCSTMPFAQPYEPSREHRAQLRAFTSDFIGRYISNTKLMDAADKDGTVLKIDDELKMQVIMLKELTWQFVIKRASLVGMQRGQRNALRTLFEIYTDAVNSNDPHGPWMVLPARSFSEMDSLWQKYGATIPEDERIRVAADAIAGMTDQQAILMYHRLTGISAGSVLDAIVI